MSEQTPAKPEVVMRSRSPGLGILALFASIIPLIAVALDLNELMPRVIDEASRPVEKPETELERSVRRFNELMGPIAEQRRAEEMLAAKEKGPEALAEWRRQDEESRRQSENLARAAGNYPDPLPFRTSGISLDEARPFLSRLSVKLAAFILCVWAAAWGYGKVPRPR